MGAGAESDDHVPAIQLLWHQPEWAHVVVMQFIVLLKQLLLHLSDERIRSIKLHVQ